MRALIVLTLLSLAACASAPTVYAPAGQGNRGYSEQQIESDRFRVTFEGGSDVSFRELEDLALRRAADLTLEQGGDWFLIVSRGADGNDDNPVRLGGSVGQSFGSYRGSSVGLGVSFDMSAGEKSITMEIVIQAGDRPDMPEAYDAREILLRLDY